MAARDIARMEYLLAELQTQLHFDVNLISALILPDFSHHIELASQGVLIFLDHFATDDFEINVISLPLSPSKHVNSL